MTGLIVGTPEEGLCQTLGSFWGGWEGWMESSGSPAECTEGGSTLSTRPLGLALDVSFHSCTWS